MQRISLALGLIMALFSGTAWAVTIQTNGSGSAVTSVDALADFESNPAALFDNPYSECNMLFSRTNLSFNNGGCGFPGCVGALGFSGFTGNYMYGAGSGGFFEITAGGSNTFTGLEFITGPGYGVAYPGMIWEAYDSGSSLVGFGSFAPLSGSVIGFSDASGFKTLKFTSSFYSFADFTSTYNAPAFDSVRAQFSNVSAVPEPSTILLLGSGLVGLAAWRKRRQA